MENHRNHENSQQLKRVFLGPVEDQKLEPHEIGIKSGVKGSQIKQLVDRVVHRLIIRRQSKLTLKAIGINN